MNIPSAQDISNLHADVDGIKEHLNRARAAFTFHRDGVARAFSSLAATAATHMLKAAEADVLMWESRLTSAEAILAAARAAAGSAPRTPTERQFVLGRAFLESVDVLCAMREEAGLPQNRGAVSQAVYYHLIDQLKHLPDDLIDILTNPVE
jgi:hypothetical protein